MRAEDILQTYDRVAHGYVIARDRSLFERRWLDRMINHATGRRLLDLGCGPGVPIGQYLMDRRCRIIGVDGAPAMIDLYRHYVPEAETIVSDMRRLALDRTFDMILAWDSLFHLTPIHQRGMFPVFAAHAQPGTVLMFTSGPEAGEPVGEVAGQRVYHASLDPEEYRAILDDYGFDLVDYCPNDPDCRGHTIWMARARKAP